MGTCSTKPGEIGLVRHQEVSHQHPEETPAHAEASAMGERPQKTDFNYFLEVNNTMVKMVKEKFEHLDELLKDNCELKRSKEQVMKENESLRQRYVIRLLYFIVFIKRSRVISSGTEHS